MIDGVGPIASYPYPSRRRYYGKKPGRSPISFNRTWTSRRICRCCIRPGTPIPHRIWGRGS